MQCVQQPVCALGPAPLWPVQCTVCRLQTDCACIAGPRSCWWQPRLSAWPAMPAPASTLGAVLHPWPDGLPALRHPQLKPMPAGLPCSQRAICDGRGGAAGPGRSDSGRPLLPAGMRMRAHESQAALHACAMWGRSHLSQAQTGHVRGGGVAAGLPRAPTQLKPPLSLLPRCTLTPHAAVLLTPPPHLQPSSFDS